MSNIVGYAIGEYVCDDEDHEEDDNDDEERDFYEIVTAWIHPKYVQRFFVSRDTPLCFCVFFFFFSFFFCYFLFSINSYGFLLK